MRQGSVSLHAAGTGLEVPLNLFKKDVESGDDDDIIYPSAVPFVLVHVGCIAAIWTGISWPALAICVTLYRLRIFAIGAGYHRYFSHRAYSTSRAFQFALALLSQTTAQKRADWGMAADQLGFGFDGFAADDDGGAELC